MMIELSIIFFISVESTNRMVDAIMVEYDRDRKVMVFFSEIFPAVIIFLFVSVSVPYFASNASLMIIEFAHIAVASDADTMNSLFNTEDQSLLAAQTPENATSVVLGRVSGLDIFSNVSVISGIS